MTITDQYLTAIPGYWVLLAALPLGLWIWRRPTSRRRKAFEMLALVHVAAVIALTIFPIPIAGQEYYRIHRGLSEDNIVPFGTISSQLTHLSLNHLRQLLGNMVALAPFGIYGPELWPALRRWRRFVPAAIAFGVAIELTQLAGSLIEGFTYRVTDVDDATMNATGAVITFFVWGALEARPPVRDWLVRLFGE
jgi:glycopeptide antibiotics resistance protein